MHVEEWLELVHELTIDERVVLIVVVTAIIIVVLYVLRLGRFKRRGKPRQEVQV